MTGYLAKLAIENSSAYASLLSKVLPSTLASESDGGVGVQLVFRREIVYPNGHVEIEGVTPKALPSPDAPRMLPSSNDQAADTNDINPGRRLCCGCRRKGGRGVGRVINRTGTRALILPTPTEMRVSVSENFRT